MPELSRELWKQHRGQGQESGTLGSSSTKVSEHRAASLSLSSLSVPICKWRRLDQEGADLGPSWDQAVNTTTRKVTGALWEILSAQDCVCQVAAAGKFADGPDEPSAQSDDSANRPSHCPKGVGNLDFFFNVNCSNF